MSTPQLDAQMAQRWADSLDQRLNTREALQAGDLSLANSEAELSKRSKRLKRHDLELEGIVNNDDSIGVRFLNHGIRAARAVGRIIRTETGSAAGTGSLVTPRILLTNHHVCRTAESAGKSSVQFNYYLNEANKIEPDQRELEPDKFFVYDEELDFALVAVASTPGGAPGNKYGYLPMIEQSGKAILGEPLNVIHFPGGDPAQISIRYNRMVAEDELWIRYESDTRHGSSGAPVFNDQWELVALHHGGMTRRDPRNQVLSVSGHPWTDEMGDDAKAYIWNEGARVSRIIKRIRESDLPAGKRRLISAILERKSGQ